MERNTDINIPKPPHGGSSIMRPETHCCHCDFMAKQMANVIQNVEQLKMNPNINITINTTASEFDMQEFKKNLDLLISQHAKRGVTSV
ncbi:hypothetical protein M5X02_31630 [Paenibacillus alvei]|uniref:hypothetical protein n=1 Tax=Paenibacillus alvei TaxID=44250 RepID=UPI000288B2CA|nr:hypothetical protein [Paenibacillus alvei]EJW13967.1 hypothetical protein PAV_141p00730 [Paenibacillus alvei DSM 29]MCY9545180.1 hypothetical protein [Paenibacillus alvei]MCY9707671.1 hypothetical protein [Paenibacillus alvei]MEC0082817.1 hypothetical protein [Paenibacillus alvei]